MASQSLYRKWRSQTFSDLVGQEAVVRTLLNAVRDGRLAHAYLFCGPRGTGKTSVARLLAKAVNCANPHDGEPCNVCISCQEITAGRSPDVIEIDAASNTGVDNIRDLRESVNLLGTGGHQRIFIVDEVHMLSTAAFNALLKTLEEPPPHVIFVLATTEAHKVLPTIVSRCQRFNFGRFSMRDLIARLHHVAAGEGLDLEPAAADLLARAAQGGMRDALSLLDQAMAFCGTHIDLERTRMMLGLADPGAIRRIIEHVAAQQSAEGLHLLNEMVINGADLRQLNAQLSDEWRALVLARAGADVAALMDRSDDEAREIVSLARRFSLEELTACARVFARNETPARGLPVPQLALELSFLECLAIKRMGGAPTLAQPAVPSAVSLPQMREVSRGSMPAAATPEVAAVPERLPAPMPAPRQAVSRAQGIEELDLAAIANETAAPPPTIAAPTQTSAAPAQTSRELLSEDQDVGPDEPPLPPEPLDELPPDSAFADDDVPARFSSDASAHWLGQAQSQWQLVKQVCKQKSMSVAALLNSARPVLVEPGEVPTLVLQAEYQFHLEKLRDPKSRVAIEWALEQVLSTPLRVRMMLAKGNGDGSTGPGGTSSGPRGGSSPASPRAAGGPNGASGNLNSAPAAGGARDFAGAQGEVGRLGAWAGKNGSGQSGEEPRFLSRDDTPQAGRSAPVPAPSNALLNEHNGHNGHHENPGKNGNSFAGPTAVHDSTAAYMPANVTPIRPAVVRDVRDALTRLEVEVRADAVIQTLLKSGIELADVQPLEDDE